MASEFGISWINWITKKKKDRLREISAFGAKNAMYGLVAEALHCTLIVNIAHEEY